MFNIIKDLKDLTTIAYTKIMLFIIKDLVFL
jgi:hypothetical protein